MPTTKTHKSDSYYKTKLSPKVIQELKKDSIDIERFERDLWLIKNQHLKNGQPFVLTSEIKQSLIASQKAMLVNTQASSVPLRVREANEAAAKVRHEAENRRKRAQAYTGSFPEDKSEQEKVLSMLHAASEQSTIGMTPFAYALNTTSNIIVRLNECTKESSVYAQELIKNIASEFEKQEKRMRTAEISVIEYAINCKKILTANTAELKKPQTFLEAVHDFSFNSIRAILNIFDTLYTWLMSKENTLAKKTGYKPYVPTPQTALAIELDAIHGEFPRFKRELTQQMQNDAANDKKHAQHLERKEAAKIGKHPQQEKIDRAKERFGRLKHLRKENQASKENSLKAPARHDRKPKNMEDLVKRIVKSELLRQYSLLKANVEPATAVDAPNHHLSMQ